MKTSHHAARRLTAHGRLPQTIGFALMLAVAAHAGPRTSASYSVAAETTDGGGKRAASASYTNDGSAGGVAGISTVASPAGTAKTGYVAQLYDVTGLTLTGAATSVNEGAALQLGAWLTLDDATFLAIPAASVTWSVASGPLTIDAGGLATGGAVFQNTAASAQGLHLGFPATFGVTVVNTLSDNFGTYAGDGLADDWQVLYFGQDNPLAAPGVDADGDTHTNAFEFTAGLVPTDNASRFSMRVDSVAGQPAQRKVVFSPVFANRSYTVEFRTSLTSGTWQPLTGTTPGNNGEERTVIDPNATEMQKFYRVKVEKP